MDYIELESTAALADHVCSPVSLRGNVSNMPWQHMIDYRKDYPEIVYFDMDGDQIVLYAKTPITGGGL